jgi:hypothetical protein
MEECDVLFFYQLLLPIVDPAISGIKGHGHVFRPTTAEELLVWDGIVCPNINTNIAESWMMNQSNTFD